MFRLTLSEIELKAESYALNLANGVHTLQYLLKTPKNMVFISKDVLDVLKSVYANMFSLHKGEHGENDIKKIYGCEYKIVDGKNVLYVGFDLLEEGDK